MIFSQAPLRAEEPQAANLSIKAASQAPFWPLRENRLFLLKWPPDCRTESFKTAKHIKNRGLGALPSQKVAPKPKMEQFLAIQGLGTRAFKQKRPKNGLLSAGFFHRKPSCCRTEGFQIAKHYKNRGLRPPPPPKTKQKKKTLANK